jgi:phosphate transport system substrate-binding protein
MLPLLSQLSAAYTERHPNVSFDLLGVGSAGGLELLQRGQADIALVSRELLPDEEQDTRSGARLRNASPVALDAVAIIVNARNSVRAMDLHSLRRLFRGQVADWSELGGPPNEVCIVSREEGSATRRVFEQLVMTGYPVTSGAVVMPSSAAVVSYVAQNEGAVGYVSLGHLGAGTTALQINDVLPERATIENGRYPLVRPFLLATLPTMGAEVTAFVDFARGPSGLAIVRRLYGDPLPPSQSQP